jgi:hypothetical protein
MLVSYVSTSEVQKETMGKVRYKYRGWLVEMEGRYDETKGSGC